MIKSDKRLCVLVLAMVLGLYNGVSAQENETDFSNIQQAQVQKVKANKETFEKAQEAFANKDFQTVINLMTSYINEKPKKFEPYKLRGDAYYALRRYDLAQKDYRTAVDIKSADDKMATSTKYISAIILGADKYEQLQNADLGDLYGALMYAQKAQNDSEYLTSYENAVKYNSHIYLPEPKKQDINKINCPEKYGKKVNPTGIDEKIYGAIDDIENENFNEALYKLQSVTSQYPKYYMGYYLSGVALAGLDKNDDAIKAFETSINLNPYDFESYASLGQIYYQKAETTFSKTDAQKSIEYFNKALSLNKNCPTYYFYIGMNELQNGDINLAINNFNRALKLNPSDYNSMYYKTIAQYINGNYQDVVDGATKLLYRHVSNYNSVMYLRALAYTKINETQKALQDLDTIESNINDIYNTDIKTPTAKEKSLISYVHYLKSEIQHSLGAGSAEDNAQSYNNPIINRLANAQKALDPYKKSLSGETIAPNDFKKFEYFYSTSLPKLLESGAVITSNDIDNQYDYIRTTFDDLGISFVYTNPTYRITTIKDYPLKKYGSKVTGGAVTTEEQIQTPTQTENNQALLPKPVENLQQSTPQAEMLNKAGETSLAQMLATNKLSERAKEQVHDVPAVRPAVQTPASEIKENTSKAEFKPENPDGERVNSSKNIASGGQYTGASLVDDKNSQKVKTLLEEEKSMEENKPAPTQNSETKAPENYTIKINTTEPKTVSTIPETQTKEDGSIKITAKEFKETPDIVIKHEAQPAIVQTPVKTVSETAAATAGTILTAADTASAATIAAANTAAAALNTAEDTIEQLSPKEIKKQAKLEAKQAKQLAKETRYEAQQAALETKKTIKNTAQNDIQSVQQETNSFVQNAENSAQDFVQENSNLVSENNNSSNGIMSFFKRGEEDNGILHYQGKEPEEKIYPQVNEKHANINPKDFGVQNQPLYVDKYSDIVELKTEDMSKKYSDSDLFTKDKTGLSKQIPNIFSSEDFQAATVVPEKNTDLLKPVTLPEENLPKAAKNNSAQTPAVVAVPLIRTEGEKAEPVVSQPEEQVQKTVQTVKETQEVPQKAAEIIVPEFTAPAANSSKEQLAKEKLTEVIDEVLPEQSQVSEQAAPETDSAEDKITETINKTQALKEERLQLKEQAKLAKKQAKKQARAEKQRIKEEQKLAKAKAQEAKAQQEEFAKAQQEKLKETQKLAQTKEQLAKDKQEQIANEVKEAKEQALKIEEEQQKAAEQTDELKVQHIIEQQKAAAPEQTQEQKKALQAQLKAERKQAKEEYKARKAAQKQSQQTSSNFKNFLSKMKFWKKETVK